ncbi:DUF3343 domain-containing protein [Aminiphilus circumscriptus]|uniref:DUF3343 domain-containing protein n=1 Tax=Aminiphilus circumscriptus TaxID=290732 RepID=UPI000492BFDA|nr:DUF3343 domain-containing protein [Aminiphilus circumscriptus]
MFCIATFETTHMALRFEKMCRAAGINARITPVPRELSASCGLACRFPCEARDHVRALCEKNHVEVAEYHKMEE